MSGEVGDGLPLEVRDALAELLLAALHDRHAGGALERAADLAQQPRGARIAPESSADERGRDGTAALLATGLLKAHGPVDGSDPPGTSGIVGAASRILWRASPAWEPVVRLRLEAYLRVARAVPHGRSLAITLTQARALFAEGLFFEVHEILEPPWQASTGAERHVLQGLIQAAVAYYHLRRGNQRGAEVLARSALEKLEGAGATWHGFDLAEVQQSARRLADWLDAGAHGDPPAGPFASSAVVG